MALAFDVRRSRLESNDVTLAQHQFGGVLDGHDTLGRSDKARKNIQKRRLSGAGAARNEGVEAAGDCYFQELQHRRGERVPNHEIVGAQPIGSKSPN